MYCDTKYTEIGATLLRCTHRYLLYEPLGNIPRPLLSNLGHLEYWHTLQHFDLLHAYDSTS